MQLAVTDEDGMTLLARFLRDESGATAIEYGLIATFIALIVINVLRSVGTKLNADFSKIAGNL